MRVLLTRIAFGHRGMRDPLFLVPRYILVLTLLTPLAVSTLFLSSYVFFQSRLLFTLIVFLLPFTISVMSVQRSIPFKRYLPALLPWLLLLVALVISSFAGVNTLNSLQGTWERFGSVMDWVVMFFFCVELLVFLSTTQHWDRFWQATTLVATLVAAIGLAQAMGYGAVYFTGARVFSTLGNPAFMASYLLLTIGVTLFLLQSARTRFRKIMYLVSTVVQCLAVFLSGTRAAFLGLGAMVIVIACFYLYYYVLARRKVSYSITAAATAIFLFLLCVLGAVSFIVRPEIVHDSVNRIKTVIALDQTARDRIYVWDIAVRGFWERPVLGWGENNFMVVFQRYFNPVLYRGETQSVWYDRAHSELFERLSAGGLIGLGTYILWVAVPLFLFFKRSRSDRRFLILIATVLGYFVYLLFYFHSIADTMLFVSLYAFSVYAVKGTNQAEKDHGTEQPRPVYRWYMVVFCCTLGMLASFFIYGPSIRGNYRTKQALHFIKGEEGGFLTRLPDLPPQGLRALAGELVPLVDSGVDVCRSLVSLVTRYPHEVRWWLIQAYAAPDCFEEGAFDVALAALGAARRLAPQHPHVYHTAGLIFFNRSLPQAPSEDAVLGEYADASYRAFFAASTLAPGILENELMQLVAQALRGEASLPVLRSFVHRYGHSFDPYTRALTAQVAYIIRDSELQVLAQELQETR